MFRLQDERQTERFIGTCRELLLWAKEHDVDIQIRTDCRIGIVIITLASDGLLNDLYFSEDQFNDWSTENIFNVLRFYYEDLVDKK